MRLSRHIPLDWSILIFFFFFRWTSILTFHRCIWWKIRARRSDVSILLSEFSSVLFVIACFLCCFRTITLLSVNSFSTTARGERGAGAWASTMNKGFCVFLFKSTYPSPCHPKKLMKNKKKKCSQRWRR